MENNSSVKIININQILEPKQNQISLSVYQCKFLEYIDKNNKNLPEDIRKIISNNTFGFSKSQSFIGKNISQEHYGLAILDLKDVNPLIEFNMVEKVIPISGAKCKVINLQASQNNIQIRNNGNNVLNKIKQKQDIDIDEIRIAMYNNFMKNKEFQVKEFQVEDIEFLAKQLIDKDPNLANVCLLSQILSLNKNESSISPALKESILKYYKTYFSKKDISYEEIEFAIMTNQQYIKLSFDEPKKDTENDLFKIINDNSGKDQDEYKKNLRDVLMRAKILDISYLNLETIEGVVSYLEYLEEKLESLGQSLQPDYQQLNEVARLKIKKQEGNILNEFTEMTEKIDALIEENKTKIYKEGGKYIKRLSNLKFCDQENHNIQELNEILKRNLVFRAQKDLLSKSIEELRDSFKDLSRGDFFDRIEKIDQAMKDLVDNCSDGKIKELFPEVKYYEDLGCLSSNYLFFKQMDLKYANELYQEINKSTENQVFLDVLKVEYLSYLISNNLIFDEKYQNDINEIFEILTIKATNIFSKPRTITDIFSRKMIDKLTSLKGEIKIADNALKIMTPSLNVEDLKCLLPKVTLEQLFDLCRNTKDTQEEKVRSKIFRATKEEINNNVQFSSKLYDILQEEGEKFVETIKFLAIKQKGQESSLISSEQLFALLNEKEVTPLHFLAAKDSKKFLETIKFLATKQEGQSYELISSEQLVELLSKEDQLERTPLHILVFKDDKTFLETIKFLATKQEGQESAFMSSEQLFALLSKEDQWERTPLHRFAKENPKIFFKNIEFLAIKQEGQSSAFMSSDTLLKILKGNFRDTFQPLLDGLAQQNPEILLKAIKSLLKIPSIRSEGYNFLKPIFNAFYGRMPQNKNEAKKVNKIVQDIYFNLAITPIVNDETVYRHAHYLAKNKEEKLNDYGCFMLCFFPLAIGEKGYKYAKHTKKEEALCGFTLPKKPEDMILKYSQHRSPEDILKNYGEINDGLAYLANAINKLKPNKIKEFLQNLYKNDLPKDKSKFEELVYKISQSNNGELKGRLEKIEFNTGNTGIFSKISLCFKKAPKKPSIKIVDIIVRGALKAEAKTQEELVEQEDAKADFELKDINESVIPNKRMANKIINPKNYRTLQQIQQKKMQLAGV